MDTDTDAQRYARWLRGQCPTAGCEHDGCEWHDAAGLLEVLGEIATIWDAMLDSANQTIDTAQGILDAYWRKHKQPTTCAGLAALQRQTIDRVRIVISEHVRQRDDAAF